MSNVAFLQELLNTVAETGRSFLPRSLFRDEPEAGLQTLVEALMSGRGEASGIAVAWQLTRHYRVMDRELREVFFKYINERLKPDSEKVAKASRAYLDDPSEQNLQRLQEVVESPRREFFRRLNMAPGATAEIVKMRKDLLVMMRKNPELAGIDSDIKHLLDAWFNRGFLVLRRIDWQTPAVILDKIIAYEAVHEISGWDELRRRLEPADRRCFAFFHPSMVDEPLIFVEVALTNEISDSVQKVLAHETVDDPEAFTPTTAVFYSISNCQKGLRGISFGNFLIKQVVEELLRECPSLKTFVTLSPVPGFMEWLQKQQLKPASDTLSAEERAALTVLSDDGWHFESKASEAVRGSLMALAARYFLAEKNGAGLPIDPVARFHLGNGARLERINWMADTSERGIAQSGGIMVNYLYELKEIERNHEAFVNDGTIAASRSVRGLLKGKGRQRGPITQERPTQERPTKELAKPEEIKHLAAPASDSTVSADADVQKELKVDGAPEDISAGKERPKAKSKP